jgi:tRNA-specific 2-thiouridylase
VALGYPVYVVDKDPEANTVTVGPREALASAGLVASGANWLVDPPAEPTPCHVKIRYNAAPVAATVQPTDDDSLAVRFESPQFAVAPGQAAVCYRGDRVIAGGWIDRAVNP